MWNVELSLQHGIENLKISSTSSLKHVSFGIYSKSFESGIAPLSNSSWIILSFSVDKHNREVLDPISYSLDRVVLNSGAGVSFPRTPTLL